MFRMWCKIIKDNHLLSDTVVSYEDPNMSRTSKVLTGLNEACHTFDLAVPLWLDPTIEDFRRHSKTRFRADNFVEEIDFDYLEIQVIEE